MFERTKNLRLSIIKQMEIEAKKYSNVISLAQGIHSFDTPEIIKNDCIDALNKGLVSKYSLSLGLPELRKEIQKELAKDEMIYDWEKEIIVTVGAIEALTATIFTITEQDDEIIIFDPSYTSYQGLVTLAGCKPVFASLDEKKDWGFNVKEVEKVITKKTKAILFCNPNNPTGTIFNKKQILSLGELALKHNLFLITDEVYKDFEFGKKVAEVFSIAQEAKFKDRVIRIFSFSKSYSMTGWRIAYINTHELIAKEIIKTHDLLVTCAPVISQYAAISALKNGSGEVARFKDSYEERLNLVCKRLDKLKNVFEYVKPEGAYYIFPKIKPESSKEFVNERGEVDSWKFSLNLLDKIQVALVPGVAFGPNGEGHVRISFSRSAEDINEAFDRMEKFFK